MPVRRRLVIRVGWDHDPRDPFLDAGVDPMLWSRRLLGLAAPGQMHFRNATVGKLEQSIVCTSGVGNWCQRESAQ